MDKKMIPIGVSNFYDMQTMNYYYVDKSNFIKDLLNNLSAVTLFTRPRRFGKTLNMNMLMEFLDIKKDSKELFKGLNIEKETILCEKWQNKYPVIFISLKEVEGLNFESALDELKIVIANLYKNYSYLLKNKELDEDDIESFKQIKTAKSSITDIKQSLQLLTRLLYQHYNQKVVILIDEYDVPLQKASINGYYEYMLDIIRAMMNKAFKDNPYLSFGVITGCLRVSKESIFTGFNNLRVCTISDTDFSGYFGFTQGEVFEMLKYYNFEDKMETVKYWYDGYLFGNTEIYCPFSVINYVRDLISSRDTEPKNYWVNSSSNDIIKSFIIKADENTLEEFKALIQGKNIIKPITETLTYAEINKNIDNLWSMLYISGYLTKVKHIQENLFELRIPNEEVKEVFISKINDWFKEEIFEENADVLKELCIALKEGKAKTAESRFNKILRKSMSLRDIQTQTKKEVVYHSIFLGALNRYENWEVNSNFEAGEGYADIVVKDFKAGKGFIIEFKNAISEKELDKEIERAFMQIEDKKYTQAIQEEDIKEIYLYAVACYNKMCKIEMKKMQK